MYRKPIVKLLQNSNLAIGEIGARLCYDSLDKSESLKDFRNDDFQIPELKDSELLDKLVNAYHHESMAEHIVFTFYINNISRGVLQELARHRIASLSVRSTRYTMSKLLVIAYLTFELKASEDFLETYIKDNVLVLDNKNKLMSLEIQTTIEKLRILLSGLAPEFIFAKKQLELYNKYKGESLLSEDTLVFVVKELLALPNKKNVGDSFKTIVTDNWRTELLFTINARSLKNFLNLRTKNSAWAPMRELAKSIQNVIPERYYKILGVKS
jgi:thymidylate synthase (FAD)